MRLVLLRGLPGSGKSSFAAKKLPENCCVVSADSFFVDSQTGDYNFNHNGLLAAHIQCQEQCRVYMHHKRPLVCVDNCNLSASGDERKRKTSHSVRDGRKKKKEEKFVVVCLLFFDLFKSNLSFVYWLGTNLLFVCLNFIVY
jgi:hypothetical protein